MDKNADIQGWAATNWGMTEEDILELLKPEAVRLEPPVEYPAQKREATVGIAKKDIAGRNFEVHFLFDDKALLDNVVIRPTDENPVGVFEHLRDLLLESYGPPKTIIHEEFVDKVIWGFPSTTVVLQKVNAVPLDMLSVTLSFERTKPADRSFL